MPPDAGARRRLSLIAAAAASLTLGNVAWDVLGPLWATAELGLDPDGWAQLRSLRFAGTLVGTVIIGLAAGAWGVRAVGIAALAAAAATLAAIAAGGRPLLALAMPVFGATISAVFISLNTLTQQVGREHQAKANALYRSVCAGVTCVVPVAATIAAAVLGYATTLGVAAALLALGAVALLLHPREEIPRQGGFGSLLVALIAPLRRGRLRTFLLLELGFSFSMCGAAAFTALILARDLGLPDGMVGGLLTTGAVAAFVGTLLSQRLQRRLDPLGTILICWGTTMAAMLLLGAATGITQAAIAITLAGLATGAGFAPLSYVVARLGEEGREAQTFTVWKVSQGFSAAVGMQACALLEPRLGMGGVLAWGTAVALLPAALMLLWRRRGDMIPG